MDLPGQEGQDLMALEINMEPIPDLRKNALTGDGQVILLAQLRD